MMNHSVKKMMTLCLAAALAVSAFGCSKKEDAQQDMPVETISLEQTKQDLTFDYSKKGPKTEATEPKEDATEPGADTQESTAQNDSAASDAPKFEEVTQAMNVTDAEGHGVTDAAGQSVTEWVVVETRPVQNQQPANNQPAGNSNAQADNGNTPADNGSAQTQARPAATQAAYTPAYDTCKAYWLDMTKQGDYTFNGEFLTITFEVNKDTPDGNYPVTIATTDIASWELVRYDPVCINGEIAVGSKAAAQKDISADDFCLKVNSQEAKQGEIVTMTIDLANNPGFCGFVIDIQYDSNALTIVEAEGGKDFDEAVSVAN